MTILFYAIRGTSYVSRWYYESEPFGDNVYTSFISTEYEIYPEKLNIDVLCINKKFVHKVVENLYSDENISIHESYWRVDYFEEDKLDIYFILISGNEEFVRKLRYKDLREKYCSLNLSELVRK